MEKFQNIQKYGPFTCIILSLLPGLGLFFPIMVAWILHWNKWVSIICTVMGFSLASLFFLLI
jgi:hypothetical protein